MTNTSVGGADERRPDDRPMSQSQIQFAPKSELTKALGDRLRGARKAAGKSIKDTAEALDCSVNAYRMKEAGASEMRSGEIITVASFFGVDPASLLEVEAPAAGDHGTN